MVAIYEFSRLSRRWLWASDVRTRIQGMERRLGVMEWSMAALEHKEDVNDAVSEHQTAFDSN